MSRRVEMKALHIVLFLLVGLVSFDATSASSGAYVCKGQLQSTTAKNVTCRRALKRCKVGSIVWQPVCSRSCVRKAYRRCARIKAKKKRVCVPPKPTPRTDGAPAGKPKQPLSCPQQAVERRNRCRTLSEGAQGKCRQKARTAPCRQIFATARSSCDDLRQTRLVACRKSHNKRLHQCRRFGKKLGATKNRICKRKFALCIANCLPGRWPCRKRCFLKRHRCFTSRRDTPSSCRSTSSRLLSECELKVEQRQTRCIANGERKMYSCMQRLSRKRVLCMIGVGRQYRKCIGSVQDQQLFCWFKQMDRSYLCSGRAYRHCRADLSVTIASCRTKCPLCKLASK